MTIHPVSTLRRPHSAPALLNCEPKATKLSSDQVIEELTKNPLPIGPNAHHPPLLQDYQCPILHKPLSQKDTVLWLPTFAKPNAGARGIWPKPEGAGCVAYKPVSFQAIQTYWIYKGSPINIFTNRPVKGPAYLTRAGSWQNPRRLTKGFLMPLRHKVIGGIKWGVLLSTSISYFMGRAQGTRPSPALMVLATVGSIWHWGRER